MMVGVVREEWGGGSLLLPSPSLQPRGLSLLHELRGGSLQLKIAALSAPLSKFFPSKLDIFLFPCQLSGLLIGLQLLLFVHILERGEPKQQCFLQDLYGFEVL